MDIRQEEISMPNDVILTVKDVTTTTMTLQIENRTNEQLVYGMEYELQSDRYGQWQAVNDRPIAVILIAKMLPPKGFVEEQLDWAHTYGSLRRGTYRLIKRIGPYTATVQFCI